MSSTSVHQRSIIIIGEANIFCIKISVMTFLESGKEYQSIRSSKGLNFRDGCLTFGVPLWHDLCSSSPNISSVNGTICLGNENLPSCWLAEEKQSEQQDLAFFFYRRHSRTNVRFDHLFSETAPLQMTTHNICWFNKKKSNQNTRICASFPTHLSQSSRDAGPETEDRNEKCYLRQENKFSNELQE